MLRIPTQWVPRRTVTIVRAILDQSSRQVATRPWGLASSRPVFISWFVGPYNKSTLGLCSNVPTRSRSLPFCSTFGKSSQNPPIYLICCEKYDDTSAAGVLTVGRPILGVSSHVGAPHTEKSMSPSQHNPPTLERGGWGCAGVRERCGGVWACSTQLPYSCGDHHGPSPGGGHRVPVPSSRTAWRRRS